MAAITQLPDYKFVQISTPTQGDLTLSQSISASDTSLIVSYEPTNEDGTSITKDFFMQLTSTNSGKRYTETMLCTSVSGTTLTVVRGIARGGLDYVGAAGNAISHQAGTVIKANLPAGLFQAHDSALKGAIGTGARNFKIGDGTTNATQGYKVSQGLAGDLQYGADASGNPLITMPDGSSFIPGAGVGAITGGDGISITASDIDIDLADTVIFKNARTGNEIRVPITAVGDGKLDKTFMPTYVEDLINSGTTVTEIDQALDGISANVTAANLNTLTAGNTSDASLLHTHTITNYFKVYEGSGLQTYSYPQASSCFSENGDYLYATALQNTTNTDIYIYRYTKDSLTGQYYCDGKSGQLTYTTDFTIGSVFTDNKIGIVEVGGYIYVTCNLSAATKIWRFDADLTNKTAMTISGSMSGLFGSICGSGSTLYMAQGFNTNTNLYPLTISGTTLTVGSTIAIPDQTRHINSMYHDGTNIYYNSTSASLLRKINTSGVSQATSSFAYDLICSGGMICGIGFNRTGILNLIALNAARGLTVDQLMFEGYAITKF